MNRRYIPFSGCPQIYAALSEEQSKTVAALEYTPHVMTYIIIMDTATTPASVMTQREGLEMATAMVKKKRTIDAAFKLKVIDYALQYSNRASALMHGIHEENLQVEKTRNRLGEAPGKDVAESGRLQSSTTRHQRIDDPLKIDEKSSENFSVTCTGVQRRALEFAPEQGNGEFLYTHQWVVAEVLQACLS